MEWSVAFDQPITARLGDNDSLTIQIPEAQCTGLHLRVYATVYGGDPPDWGVIQAGALRLSDQAEVHRYALAVATRVLRQRSGSDPERDVVRALAERLEGQLSVIAAHVRASGEEIHRQRVEASLRPPSQDEIHALYEQAREIAEDPALFARIDAAMAHHVVGEVQNRKLLYLVYTSRLLSRPINAVVRGLSSAGKSHLCLQVKRFFPADAIYDLSSMSERFLLYCPYDLRHRFILLLEASGMKSEGLAATVMRTLLSEGFIRYGTVSGHKGYVQPQDGPTGFVSTTTSAALEFQMENRVLSPQIDESIDQTRLITLQQAREAAGLLEPALPLEPFVAFQAWLATSPITDARVPFAVHLADHMPTQYARMRRDFPSILGLIKTSALLHQKHRQQVTDTCVLATIDDYENAYSAVATPFAIAHTGVTPKDRIVLAALTKLISANKGTKVSISDLAKEVGMGRTTMNQHIGRLIRLGYVENNGSRGAADLVLGEPLPDEHILPSPEDVRSWST